MTTRQRRIALTFVALLAVLAVAFGISRITDDRSAAEPTATADDAFAVRMLRHHAVALALADAATADQPSRGVRRIADDIRRSRELTMPVLREHAQRVDALPANDPLGVPPEQAADEITPAAINQRGSSAYLVVAHRLTQGGEALVAAELERGTDPAIRALAQHIATDLAQERTAILTALRENAAKQQRP